MAATVGRLLKTSVKVASGGLKAASPHGTSVSKPSRILTCPALQKACFSTSTARWAPAVTQHAPHFKATAVHNGEFKEMGLDDFKGKYLVLFFYPLDFTFVCPTEIISFSDKASEFHDINCEVVGVSAGGLGEIHIPLLADLNKQVSRDYGVLLEGPGIALRGLFIIDPNGVVKHMSVNDLPVGRCVDETLRLVRAFQFVETHGEVCPASWTPDSPTIKPTPEGSKEYFEKVND
ncbi:unnamed protein product [Coregonus sp. 'balchen']|nr:unnamed protein product [Coregonus sp. 'balchen']